MPLRIYREYEVPRNSRVRRRGAGVVRSFPELPGCASFGRDEAEAQRGIEEAIHLYLTPDELDLPVDAKLIEVTVG